MNVILIVCSLFLASDPIPLPPGAPVEGRIEADSPAITTPRLETEDPKGLPTRGVQYRIEIQEGGDHWVDFHSHHMKGYLVLRDENGQLLTEDDYGTGVFPRILLERVAEGQVFLLDVGSRFGDPGPFTVTLSPGQAPRPDPAAQIERARAGVAELEAGGDSAPLSNALHRLSFLIWGTPESIQLLERAVAMRESLLGEHENTAESHDNLAQMLNDAGRTDEAREHFGRALEIRKAVFGDKHLKTSETQHNFASFLQRQGRDDEAVEQFQGVLATRIAILGDDHPQTLFPRSEIAKMNFQKGNYEAALPYYEAMVGMQQYLQPRTAFQIRFQAGMCLYELGRYPEAREIFEKIMEERRRSSGESDELYASALNNLGGVLKEEGNFADARLRFERALALLEEQTGEESDETASAAHNLGRVILEQVIRARAEGENKRAEALFEEAKPLFERALALREKNLGPDAFYTTQTLENLGRLYFEIGRLDEAEDRIERSVAARSAVLGPKHPWTAYSLHNLASLRSAQGRHADALEGLEAVLAIRTEMLGETHLDTTRTLRSLALVQRDAGQPAAAWETAKRAIATSEKAIQNLLWSLNEFERLRFAVVQNEALEVLLSLEGASGSETARVEAYEALLRWKGRVSRSLVADTGRILENMDEERKALIAELRDIQSELSDSLYAKTIQDADAYQARLVELRERRTQLEQKLVRSSKSSGPGATEEKFEVASVRGSLPEGSAVVDFFVHRTYEAAASDDDAGESRPGRWSEPRLSAWILQADGDGLARLDLGPADTIERAVKAFLEELVSTRGVAPDDEEEEPPMTTEANDTLRALLWDPVKEQLGESETVFLSPDRFLGGLPMEILQYEDGTFLIEEHGFVYMQDIARLTAMPAPVESDNPRLLAVGGVDYRKRGALEEEPADEEGDGTRGYRGRWSRLSWTSVEADAVEELFEEWLGEEPERVILKKADATEERIKSELPGATHVHFATHGFFQPEGVASKVAGARGRNDARKIQVTERKKTVTGQLPGLLSGLVFAGANAKPEEGRDNGLLTAEEVSWVDLSQADLVVLSACETGLGQAAAGEGILGLRRAFRQGGARTVISSLWSVKDEATSDLMLMFYENLWLEEMGKLEALREAQLALLEQNRIDYDGDAIPSTWGAFVLDGDWR